VVGTGDYDGNLNSDLLWENASTGALTLWRLAGGQVLGTTVLDRSSLPAAEEWHVGGSGDVDGDGADDLMMWSRVKGQVEIWTLSGGAVATRTRLTGHVGAWSVVAVDDIDGDGKAEIVWLDELHRVLELRDPAAAASVGLGDLAAGWRGRGGADLAGDGSAELVLQDTATGAAQAWELDDRGVLGSADLPTARNLGAYAGAGDFDGNGSEDIAWSDTTDRAVTLWLGSAGAPVSRLVDRPLPTGGEVVSGATASDDSAFRDRFCASDLNGDGRVTNRDVKVIKVCLDKPGTGDCEIADMDGDRWVTTGDFDVFVLRFRHQRCEPW
jgi:hypothetical protein